MNATWSGIAAAMWLGGLWYAAPLLSTNNDETGDRPASRLRDATLLGTAIPLLLAVTSLLTAASCIAALSALIALRIVRYRPNLKPQRPAASSVNFQTALGRALPTFAVTVISWPALVRPILQGDSLGYHLPNAASWSVTHTLFTAGTRYWWYPGGSELFAAGIFTVSGPLAVGLSGTVACLLLAHRLYAFAHRAGFGPIPSGSFAAVTMTLPTIALQGASLENDVWLTAWLLEIVWATRYERQAVARVIGLCVLLKPYGFIYAAVAAMLGRVQRRVTLLGFLPLVIWLLRDAILWHSATIDPSSLAYPHIEQTTIAAQRFSGITTLWASILAQGPGMVLATLALLVTLGFSRDVVVRYTSLATAAFFLIEPFGFRNDVAQLATGASLRFALPAIVLGLVGVLPMLRRFCKPLTLGFLALATYQIRSIAAIFNNDSTTHAVYVVALTLGIASVIPHRLLRSVTTTCVSLALVTYAVRLAGTHPLDYYNERIATGHGRSGLFRWLASARPEAAVGYQLRIGAIAVATPRTLVYDATGSTSCAEARHARAVLVIADDPVTDKETYLQRRAFARACGTTLYEDAFSLVILPNR